MCKGGCMQISQNNQESGSEGRYRTNSKEVQML